jgi:hypothetical protein
MVSIFRVSQPKCGLLALPAEIREHIFAHAVVSSKPIVTFRLDNYQRGGYQEAVQPSITRVSRQLRNEALPLYYELNDFILHTEGQKSDDAHQWLHDNEAYLHRQHKLTFWLRYVDLAADRATHSGALAVTMRFDPRASQWVVRDDDWRWITVVKPPSAAGKHGKLLVKLLSNLLRGIRHPPTADQLTCLKTDLRMLYVKDRLG